MAKPLVFMMGKSPAILPVDRLYARNHMWVLVQGAALRLGFSAYAVRLLGDIHHVRWSAEVGSPIEPGGQIGYVEASKATSDLYAPVGGQIRAFNESVLSNAGLVNTNLYDSAWLLEVVGSGTGLLEPEAYLQHLEATWPFAQRLLKGQSGRKPA
ncbi:MAG: glycine cleavage system protein H [Thermoguttaceae bacterium]